MPPATLAAVVPRRILAARRATEPRAFERCDVHDDFLSGEVEVHIRDSPRPLDVEDLGVDVAVSHGDREYRARITRQVHPLARKTAQSEARCHRRGASGNPSGELGKREEEGGAPRQGKPKGGVSPRASGDVARITRAGPYRSCGCPTFRVADPHKTVKTQKKARGRRRKTLLMHAGRIQWGLARISHTP
jgi:hypothetical protein